MKIYLLTFFNLLSVLITAQVVSVSEPLTMRDDIAYELLGQPKDDILLLRDKGQYFEVQAFDKDLKLSWAKEIQLEGGRPKLVHVIPGPDGFRTFHRYKEGGNYFMKQMFFNPGANLVDSITVKDLGDPFYTPEYDVVLSENKNIALFFDYDRYSEINCFVVEVSTMTTLWEKKFEIPDFTANRDLNSILVDNRGNMILVVEKENRRSRKDEHHFEIYCIGPDYPDLYRVDIPMPQYLSFDIYFDWDNLNNQLIGGGLYIEDNVSKADGYYYLRSDLASDNAVLSFHPFKKEDVAALLGKQDVNENRGVPELKMQEIVLRRDGGILLFAERVRVYERNAAAMTRSSFDRFSRYSVDYYYDDLFVASIHPDGAIHWENVLYKKQYSQDDSAIYSSYFLMKTPTNLRLVFNDEIKNENTISEYILSPLGQAERKSVFSTANQDLRIRFRDGLQIAANEMLVPSERRGRLKLVRVTY
ncbi:MAG: hypothetical protein R2879_00455 [Saprospiraceae bacterium]